MSNKKELKSIQDEFKERYNEFLKSFVLRQKDEKWFRNKEMRETWGDGFERAILLVEEIFKKHLKTEENE